MPALEIRDLCYRYNGPSGGDWVLEDVSLQVEAGEYVLLCGASGSGKSTLCRALNGLIPHFYGGVMRGAVRVDGLDTRRHPIGELFGRVGMIFQNPTVQLFNTTVARELAYGLESLGLPREEIARRVRESAEQAGIVHLLEHNPQQLSGGEQQLTAIAAVLALHPRVIVLDEPYASLDPLNVRRVRAVLRRIRASSDPPAIVVAEHRMEHVVPDADRLLVLQRGRVVRDGPPRAVLAQASAEELAGYGLNVPPVVRAAQALDLVQMPLSVEEWRAMVMGQYTVPLETDLQAALLSQLQSALCEEPFGAAPAGDPGPLSEGDPFPLLRVEKLTFGHTRATPVLRGVNLALCARESLALVGANGSGKTTLIKHLNGLHRPQEGAVWVLGQDARRMRVSALARHVGMAFQNANDQFFKFSVRDEIEAGARALGCYDAAWLEELVALLELGPLLDRSPYRLSEGEKKRVAFCSALAARPEILVLDEPTTGQDWSFRRALGALLATLRVWNQSVIVVTHDTEFAEQCAGRWALLAEGSVIADGPPEAVLSDASALHRAHLEATQSFRLRQALREPTGTEGENA
jgi:energy-coupling factor transport system ATP-binding protein